MGKRLGLVVLLLAAAFVSSAATYAPAPDPQTSHWLRVAHTPRPRIEDDRGRTVLLRGVNVNGLGEYYQEWKDLPTTLPLTEDEFAQIASHGFNVVRLLITWSRIEPRKGVIDRAYIERIAQAVQWAKKYDIYTVIDMHQDAWSAFVGTPDGVMCPPGMTRAIGWDGAPKWATSLIGTVATCTAGIREVSAAAQLSFSKLYANVDGLQDHFVNAWRVVAQRFAGESAVAGYDLLNEPNPGMTPGVNDAVSLGLLYRNAIVAIRSVDKRHSIYFEPAVLTGPMATPGPVSHFSSDRNLVYAPHNYNESISPLPFGSIRDGFTNMTRAGKRYGGAPVFVGEWGWFGNSSTDQPKIEEYAKQEDVFLASGTWWQWKQACGDPHAVGVRGNRPSCAGKSIYSDGYVTRSRSNMNVLSRAYVRAAPGLLTTMTSNPARLQITGVAASANSSGDIWMPSRCGKAMMSVWQGGKRMSRSNEAERVDGGSRFRPVVPNKGNYEITIYCA